MKGGGAFFSTLSFFKNGEIFMASQRQLSRGSRRGRVELFRRVVRTLSLAIRSPFLQNSINPSFFSERFR